MWQCAAPSILQHMVAGYGSGSHTNVLGGNIYLVRASLGWTDGLAGPRSIRSVCSRLHSKANLDDQQPTDPRSGGDWFRPPGVPSGADHRVYPFHRH